MKTWDFVFDVVLDENMSNIWCVVSACWIMKMGSLLGLMLLLLIVEMDEH
jgi:hypothetical protein